MTDALAPCPEPEKQPRQNTGNHPDPLAEVFTITAADLAALTTYAANASNAAGDDNRRREREAWAQFDAVAERVKSQPLSEAIAAWNRRAPTNTEGGEEQYSSSNASRAASVALQPDCSTAPSPSGNVGTPLIADGMRVEIGPDADYIQAALSWYDGGPASADVRGAWERIKGELRNAHDWKIDYHRRDDDAFQRALRIIALESALRPFANAGEATDPMWSDERRAASLRYDELRVKHFRDAARALTPSDSPALANGALGRRELPATDEHPSNLPSQHSDGGRG